MLPTTTRRIPSGSSFRDYDHHGKQLGEDNSKAKRGTCSRMLRMCCGKGALCALLVIGLLATGVFFMSGPGDSEAFYASEQKQEQKQDSLTQRDVLLTQMKATADKHDKDLQDAKKVADKAKADLIPCQADLDDCRRQNRNSEKRRKILTQSLTEERAKVQNLTKSLETAEHNIEVMKKVSKTIKTDCVSPALLVAAKKQFRTAHAERDALQKELDTLQKELKKLSIRNTHLEKALEVVKTMSQEEKKASSLLKFLDDDAVAQEEIASDASASDPLSAADQQPKRLLDDTAEEQKTDSESISVGGGGVIDSAQEVPAKVAESESVGETVAGGASAENPVDPGSPGASDDNANAAPADGAEAAPADDAEAAPADDAEAASADDAEAAPADDAEAASADDAAAASADDAKAAPVDNAEAASADDTKAAPVDDTEATAGDNAKVAPVKEAEVESAGDTDPESAEAEVEISEEPVVSVQDDS